MSLEDFENSLANAQNSFGLENCYQNKIGTSLATDQ